MAISALLLFAVLGLATGKKTPSCGSNTCCYYDAKTNSFFDLSPLKGKTFSSQDKDGYLYKFSPCGKVSAKGFVCADDPDGVLQGTAVQKAAVDPDDKKCWVLGQFDETVSQDNWQVLFDSKKKVDGVQLSTDNGTGNQCKYGLPRKLQIQYVCGNNLSPADNSWKVTQPSPCFYSIKFPTNIACVNGETPPGGLGFGTIVLIVFSSSLVLYTIVGFAIKSRGGATGMEALPSFDVLNASREGSVFFFSKVKEVVAPGSVDNSYDNFGAAAPDSSSQSYQNQYDKEYGDF